MKKPLLQRKWVWVLIVFVCFIAFLNIKSNISSSRREKKDAQIELNANKKLSGYVSVPDPYFKQKDEVEKMFKNKGLKVDFSVRNFDDVAKVNDKKIVTGMCDQLDDDSGAKYFDPSEVGLEKSGYYAKKGDTILIGYSDHDFDPSENKNQSDSVNSSTGLSDSNEQQESSNPVTSKSSSEDVEQKMDEVSAQYDDLIDDVDAYIKQPSTYTDEASLNLLNKTNELLASLNTLYEQAENQEDMKALEMYAKIQTKNSKLTMKLDKLNKLTE